MGSDYVSERKERTSSLCTAARGSTCTDSFSSWSNKLISGRMMIEGQFAYR